MTKTAKMRKDLSMVKVRRRLFAALCMVLISLIMLSTTTFAWFTLSTAPEARSIDTTVAGNGSLEIALMPASGAIADITSGRNSSADYVDNSQTTKVANTRWGNLIDVVGVGTSDVYGLTKLNLMPAYANLSASSASFAVPEFGNDGRVKAAADGSAIAKSFDADANSFSSGGYGVRAFVTDADSATVIASDKKINAYGYVLDLAFRVNFKNGENNAKLTLADTALDRIAGAGVQGAGSSIDSESASVVRIAFIKDYGVAGGTPVLLATGRVVSGTAIDLFAPDGTATDYITELAEGVPTQISAVVFFDGGNLTNADFSTSAAANIAVNLQFTTDVATLTPALSAYNQ